MRPFSSIDTSESRNCSATNTCGYVAQRVRVQAQRFPVGGIDQRAAGNRLGVLGESTARVVFLAAAEQAQHGWHDEHTGQDEKRPTEPHTGSQESVPVRAAGKRSGTAGASSAAGSR